MKKLYFLFTLLIGFASFGQEAVITGYVDSPCPSQLGRTVEIYVDGTIDFTGWNLVRQANGGGFTTNIDISGLGTLTDTFAYISNDAATVTSEFGISTNIIESGSITDNGDDAFQLIDGSSNVIDRFGEDGVDGTGTAWEHLDTYYYRVDGIPANGGAFSSVQFTYGALNLLDGEGLCNSASALSTLVPFGTYSTTGSATATIAFTAPTDGTTYAPGTTSVDVEWSTLNTTGSETVDITVNGTTYNGVSSPYSITTTDGQTYNVTVELVDGTVIDSDAISFSVGSLTTVADITALRADVTANGTGLFYEITGGSLLTHTDGYNNRKWFQDSNISGVLVFDSAGTIATTYAVGDLVTGLKGYTQEVNGVLQFVPFEDAGVIASSGNPVVPQTVTIADFNATPDDYESELIEFQNVTFPAGDGTATFSTGTNYDVSDGTNTTAMRTDFYSADYIGSVIPTSVVNLVGVGGEYNGSAQVYARSLADITLSNNTFQATDFNLYPNPTSTGFVTINTNNASPVNVKVFDILGKQVLESNVANSQLNVSALNSGIYILKLTQDNASVTKKLVIE